MKLFYNEVVLSWEVTIPKINKQGGREGRGRQWGRDAKRMSGPHEAVTTSKIRWLITQVLTNGIRDLEGDPTG